MTGDGPTVLVVDDERGLADLYSAWLESECQVRTAYDGTSALTIVDEGTDVVLLDRRMPDMSGDEVLEEIKSRGLDCFVAMVTAVEPDLDILEMGFDDYVVKPVDQTELLTLVEGMLDLGDIGPGGQHYHSKISKKSALEGQNEPSTLESPKVEELNQGIEAYDSVVLSVAQQAIEAKRDELMSTTRSTPTEELEKWRSKLDSLDETDALYQIARDRVEELRIESSTNDTSETQQFLETISEDFVAEGVWLDPTVRRALNLVLHERDREEFIVNRKSLTSIAETDAAAKFEVSQEIRELARKELN